MDVKQTIELDRQVAGHLIEFAGLVNEWLFEIDPEEEIRNTDASDPAKENALQMLREHGGESLCAEFSHDGNGRVTITGEEETYVAILARTLQIVMHRFDLPGALHFAWTSGPQHAGAYFITTEAIREVTISDWVVEQYAKEGLAFDADANIASAKFAPITPSP